MTRRTAISRRMTWLAAGVAAMAIAAIAATAIADHDLPTANDPAGRHVFQSQRRSPDEARESRVET